MNRSLVLMLLVVFRPLLARCGRSPDRATGLTAGLPPSLRPSVGRFGGVRDPRQAQTCLALALLIVFRPLLVPAAEAPASADRRDPAARPGQPVAISDRCVWRSRT